MKQPAHSTKWRSISIEKTLSLLSVEPATGLHSGEIFSRRKQYGSNTIPEAPTIPLYRLWLRQFKNPLIIILLIAAATLSQLHHTSDAIVITSVLLINSIIGTFHEYRAQKTVRALKQLTPSNATVRRDGATHTIPSSDVVPGDILILSEGDRIVADARLLTADFLRVNESMLTGESAPIAKDPFGKPRQHDPLDTPMLVYAGTAITHGNAEAVVIATNVETKLGTISSHLRESKTPIPLEQDMAMLSRAVLIIIACLLAIIIAIGLLTGAELEAVLFIAVALAVSAIPEGLPAVLTITLSTGMWRLAKRHVLIKQLFAVEALGQTKILALDKTGTITLNEMMVTAIWTPSAEYAITGHGYSPQGSIYKNTSLVNPTTDERLQKIARFLRPLTHVAITHDARGNAIISGDPTEGALQILSQKIDQNLGSKHETPIFTYPFDYIKKFSGAEIPQVNTENSSVYVISGAPEKIITMCSKIETDSGIHPLTATERGALGAELEVLAERGLRVVALAHKIIQRNNSHSEEMREFVFNAFIGISDAVRPEAKDMVARVKGAGLRVIMITGDLPTTARIIATSVGIFERGDTILTGKELRELQPNEIRALLPRVSVFARVSPEDKLRIIELYQKNHYTIAMTGDGVNDAPSLIKADLGVAMGRSGTDVARQASDVLLLNDNLSSIVSAIDEGRAIYQTLRKVIVYLFATNFGEICIVATSFIIGIPLPITAAQIIWLNLVTDGFLDVALAFEPKDSTDRMPKLKRSRYLLQHDDFLSIGITGLCMTIGTITIYMANDHLPIETRRTIAVTVMAMFQWVHAWALRTERRSFFQTSPLRNPYLIGATFIVILLQFGATTFSPLQKILGTTRIPQYIWLHAIAAASSILIIEEIRKYFRRRKK